MKTHTYCPTSRAIFLAGIPDLRGVLHFPSVHSWFPGLHFIPEPGQKINDQLARVLGQEIGEEIHSGLEIFQEFADPLAGKDTTLYVGLLHQQRYIIPAHWRPLPGLLRNMPRDRNRLACLRAWQIISGVHKEQLKAAELPRDNSPVPEN